ncbi:hypothetical protein [Silvibacterium acidisoli]|uniref:hypothetical protein n=1 Tax=Acidobacteriaceae bacterium ZG23-2 TaxID=2883246 RepID=UPI00406D0BD3
MKKTARAFYRLLLVLHPAQFREEFSAEILRDFDEILTLQGPSALFADALLSLARQWTQSGLPDEATPEVEFSLLGGSYVALAQNRLTLFDLLRGSVLSTALFFWFGVSSTPETFRSFLTFLHTLL